MPNGRAWRQFNLLSNPLAASWNDAPAPKSVTGALVDSRRCRRRWSFSQKPPQQEAGSRISSSSAITSAGPRRSTRCCGAILRSSCRASRSRAFWPPTCAHAFSPRAVTGFPRRSRSISRCSPLRRPTQRIGEATPSYLFSATAASNMAQLTPSARSIAILREPAAFLRSLHLQLLRSHVETEKSLRTAIALDVPRSEGKHIPSRSHLPQLLRYSEHVRYVEQLRRYHAVFPREQVLVLIYDDFRADNEKHRSPGCCDSSKSTMRCQSSRYDETDGTLRSARNASTTCCARFVQGRSPASRSTRSAVKALTSRTQRHEAIRTARTRAVFADVPEPDDELMSRTSGSLQAGGPSPQRVPRSGPRGAVGL